MKIYQSKADVSNVSKLLIHEHVFCRHKSIDEDLAKSYLSKQFDRLAQNGVGAVVDVTTYTSPYSVSKFQTNDDVGVICCAGYYTEHYLDKRTKSKSLDILAIELRNKCISGIGRSKIKPLLLKCGSGGARPSSIEVKMISAVATAQRELGIPVQIHSCDGAEEQAEIFRRYGVDPRFLMFCHLEMGMKSGRRLDKFGVIERSLQLLDRGSYLFFNDIGSSGTKYRNDVVFIIKKLLELGYGNQMCFGADTNWSIRRGKINVRGLDMEKKSVRDFNYTSDFIEPFLISQGISRDAIVNSSYIVGKNFICQ